jgi:hypothetical protein
VAGTAALLSQDESSFVADDAVAMLEVRVLENLRGAGAAPHQKILPRRELARRLRTTQYRVKQAIARLQAKGHVYSRKGSGVYLAEQALGADTQDAAPSQPPLPSASPSTFDPFPGVPHVPLFKTLRVGINAGCQDERQIRLWRRAFDAFHREFPFVRVQMESETQPSRDKFDVSLDSLSGYCGRAELNRPLDERLLGEAGMDPQELCAGILDLGRRKCGPASATTHSSRPLHAIPLLRTTTIILANRRVLKANSQADDLLEALDAAAHPARLRDYLRIGAELERRSEGRITGINYVGLMHYCPFYGVAVSKRGGGWAFDKSRMALFLNELAPYIGHHRFRDTWPDVVSRFLAGEQGFCCIYLHSYPGILARMGKAIALTRLPLCPDGFVTEGMFMSTIPHDAEPSEEAMLLLGFLASKRGQEILVEETPEWLSVHRAVLAGQQSASPFPDGSVLYAYDPRSLCTQVEPNQEMFDSALETQAAKFFLKLQDMDTTLERMARVGTHESVMNVE